MRQAAYSRPATSNNLSPHCVQVCGVSSWPALVSQVLQQVTHLVVK